MISPPDYTATVKIIFKWKPVTGARGYECQLATSLLFTPESLVIDKTGTNALDETTPIEVRVPYPNTYYWRIRTCGADGVSDWSETMSISLPTVEDGEWSDELKISFLPHTPTPTPTPAPTEPETAVTFPDQNLEAAVRDALGKPPGLEITATELAGLC